jgi:very-short-patch-repair endonuclease
VKIKNVDNRGKRTIQERKEKFLIKAKEIHGNKYIYSKVNFVNALTKIEIICPIHGSNFQRPSLHLKNGGCRKCGIMTRSSNRASSTGDFVKKAICIYKNKYDYSKFIYIRSFVKGIIICKYHGEFLQTPNAHLRGAECPKCFGTPKKTTNEFINDAIKKWRNKYDYSEVEYNGNKRKIRIICKIHGVFSQTPNDHLTGYGCPVCQASRGELKIEKYLISNKINYIKQKTFSNCINPITNKRLKFDFYIPSKNLLIEYDGEQHFHGGYVGNHKMTDVEFIELKKRDRIKTLYAKSVGIKLLRIKYTSLDKIDNILFENCS